MVSKYSVPKFLTVRVGPPLLPLRINKCVCFICGFSSYGYLLQDPKNSKDYGRIINTRHFQ